MADLPSDRIHIRDLAVRTVIGVYPEERREKQDLFINATLYVDLSRAGQSDNIEDTVDYKRIKKAILEEVESSSYHLIEGLAERIAEIILAYPVRSVAVEISRTRKP
jgi:FolB domain-containing protein